MLLSIRRHEQEGRREGGILDRGLAEVAGIRRGHLGQLPECGDNARRHGDELLLVVGLLRDVAGDDDLRFVVDRDLGVVALDEGALVCAVRQDA